MILRRLSVSPFSLFPSFSLTKIKESRCSRFINLQTISSVSFQMSAKRQASLSPVKTSSSPIKKNKEEQENMAPVVDVDEIEAYSLQENKLVLRKIGEVQISDKKSPMKVSKLEAELPMKLFFAKITDKAHVPSKGSKLAAGYDLKSAYKYTVPARGSCLVKTDIQIKLPSGYYGRVAPRSGLALKNKIDVGAGVIDEDYRGNVGVILFNFGDVDFEVNEGDRVAQLICEKICYPEIVELENLDETERGEGGFGSTGVNVVVGAETIKSAS